MVATLALKSTTLLLDVATSDDGYPDSPPAVVILADGTALLACAVGTSAGRVTTLWHLSADGAVLGSATVEGPDPITHPGLAATGGQGALLIISKTNTDGLPSTVYPVTASGGSIAVGAGVSAAGGHPIGTSADDVARVSHTTPDGITWYLGGHGIAAAYTAAGVQIGYHDPAPRGSSYTAGWGVNPADPTRIGVVTLQGGFEYNVTPSGMTVTARPEWAPTVVDFVLGVTSPYAPPRRVVESTWPDEHVLITHDGDGSPIDSYPLPEGTASAGGVHPVDGGVLVIQDNNDPGGVSTTPHAILATAEGLTVVPLGWARTSGAGQSWSYGSFASAVRGGLGVAAGLSVPHGGSPDHQALTVWFLDLGGPVEGVLAIDTHDHPWHVVGTRDPAMPYELVIDTGTERVVEIVAGEEHLATHELVVDETGRPGTPWSHAGLFRPI